MSRETRKTKDGRYVLRAGEYERNGQKGFIFKRSGREPALPCPAMRQRDAESILQVSFPI